MRRFGTGCKENTYGFEFSQKFGKCRNRSQCNHVIGTCPKGCDRGKYGDKCVSSLLDYHIYLSSKIVTQIYTFHQSAIMHVLYRLTLTIHEL